MDLRMSSADSTMQFIRVDTSLDSLSSEWPEALQYLIKHLLQHKIICTNLLQCECIRKPFCSVNSVNVRPPPLLYTTSTFK